MLLIILMNMCFAVAIPLLKIALQYTDPVSLVTVRMLGGGALLILYAALTERIPSYGEIPWWLIAKAALFEVYILCLGEAWALDRMSASEASVIWALLPLLTAVCVRLCRGRSITRLQWLAIVIAMIGSCFLHATFCAYMVDSIAIVPHLTCPSIQFSVNWLYSGLPYFVMVGSVCSAAYGYIALEELVSAMHSVVLSSGLMMIVGGAGAFVTAAVWGTAGTVMHALYIPELWWVMLLIIILENVVALSLQTLLIISHSATFLALSSFITPVCGLLIGVWFLQDTWYHSYGVALISIFIGITLFYQQESDQKIKELLQ